MGLRLRYAAYTLPWLLDFKQKVASIPVIPGSGTGQVPLFSTAGRARVTANLVKFDRIDEVIADDEGSLMRVFDGSDIIDEWIIKRGSQEISSDVKVMPLSGPALASYFDQVLVPAFDNGATPVVDPNWKWGAAAEAASNLLSNPSFETLAFPNGGFEQGSVGSWENRNGGALLAVNNPGEARSGSWYGEIISIGSAGDGAQISLSGLYPGKTYVITGYGKDSTAAGDRYRAGVTEAINPTHTNAYTGADGTIYAEIGNASSGSGSSDGTYQSFTLAFTATSDSVQLFIEAPAGAAADIKLDDWNIAGYGVGLKGWKPLNGQYREDTFELSTAWSVDGDQSVKVNGSDLLYVSPYSGNTGYGTTGIEHDPITVVPDKTYTYGGTIYNPTGSAIVVLVVMQRITPLGPVGSPGSSYMSSLRFEVPATSELTLSKETVSDTAEIEFNVRWQYQGADSPGTLFPTGDWHGDLFFVVEGKAAATPGDILTQLLDAHDEIGNWIDYSSFDESTDSNGDAWPEEIAFEVQWGEHYGHVLDRMVDIEYEWELVPKAVPSGTLTHDLHLYVGGGRDATYQNSGVPTTAINKGQSVLGGEVIKRIPDYTSVILEGAGGAWTEDTDATTEGQFGVLEKFSANRQLLNETTRSLAAAELLAYEEANRRAVRLEIVASLTHPRPLVDYRPGDSIPIQVPPALPKESRRVQRTDYTNTYPTRYVVTGSRVLDGESAAYDLIWRMYRRFSRPPEQVQPSNPVVTSSGGEFSISIAAADATPEEIEKADFKCVGFNDQLVINQAWKKLDQISTGAGGRLVFSSGHFHIVVTQSGIVISASAGSEGYELVGVGSRGGGQSTFFVLEGASGLTPHRILNTNSSGSVTIRNIAFNGNGNGAAVRGIYSLGAGDQTVIDCTFYSLEFGVFSGRSVDQATRVYNSFFDACTTAIRAGAGAHIIGNHIEDCSGTGSDEGGVHAVGGTTAGGPRTIIENNTIQGGANYGIITGGLVTARGNHIHNNSDSGIYINSPGGIYEANTINVSGFHGIETDLDNSLGGAWIVRNLIVNPQRHGMFIDHPDYRIYDNRVTGAGQATADTYDGIHIDHDHARVMRNDIVSTSGRSRYGIRINAGTGSIVVGNDLNAAAGYGTDDYSDAGTSTVNTYPAGAIGDNFAT